MKKSSTLGSGSTPSTARLATGASPLKTAPGSGQLLKSGRQPLTPIQNKVGHGMMVKPGSGSASFSGKKLASSTVDKNAPKSPVSASSGPSASSTPAAATKSSLYKIQNGFVTKKKEKSQIAIIREDKEVQTSDDANSDIITAEVAPIEYWKELAEERRAALEEALKENEALTGKVARLEAENQELEEMVEQAKQLAEMINTISEEHACTADESGIGKDAEAEESVLSKD